MDSYSDEKIIESWGKNVSQWIDSVRGGHVESRRLATDEAIVNAVLSRSPNSVLDVGCGEGWLVRSLSAKALHVVGVDVIPSLLQYARTAGGGSFHVASHEAVANGFLSESFDLVVCNFSLLGKESVERLCKAMPLLLNPHGTFMVQTLHPIAACGELPYADGWRDGSWAGFGANFTDPPPWYFRTMESWVELLSKNRLQLVEMREPVHPGTRKPLSVIFIAELASSNRSQ